MNNESVHEDCLEHWKHNVPPKADDINGFNRAIILDISSSEKESILLVGFIAWDITLKKYYFQNLKLNNKTGKYKISEVKYRAELCSFIKDEILVRFGVSIVEGVSEETNSLKTPGGGKALH